VHADHAVAATRFGVVERGIGSGENLIDTVARPSLADTDAPGQRDAILAGVEGLRCQPRA
jgi:hypothetical protein